MTLTKEILKENIKESNSLRNKENYADFLVEITGEAPDHFSGLNDGDLDMIDGVVDSLKESKVSKRIFVVVVNKNFGLKGYEKETHGKIAKNEGITTKLVGTITVRAIRSLRFFCRKNALKKFFESSYLN